LGWLLLQNRLVDPSHKCSAQKRTVDQNRLYPAAERRNTLAQGVTTCGKARFICGQRPSAAKVGLILWNLAARLEAAPFQNGLQTAFFGKLVSAG
jgi:hypothetical protein